MHECSFTCFLHFIEKYKYEYRKTKLTVWVSTSGGKIPDNAIRTRYEKDRKLLFIARAKMRCKWTSENVDLISLEPTSLTIARKSS